jgi:uncharacterized protein (DUF1800 family)
MAVKSRLAYSTTPTLMRVVAALSIGTAGLGAVEVSQARDLPRPVAGQGGVSPVVSVRGGIAPVVSNPGVPVVSGRPVRGGVPVVTNPGTPAAPVIPTAPARGGVPVVTNPGVPVAPTMPIRGGVPVVTNPGVPVAPTMPVRGGVPIVTNPGVPVAPITPVVAGRPTRGGVPVVVNPGVPSTPVVGRPVRGGSPMPVPVTPTPVTPTPVTPPAPPPPPANTGVYAGTLVTLRVPSSNGLVGMGGQTVVGTIKDPANLTGLTIKVGARQFDVTVDKVDGQFTIRLFDNELSGKQTIAVTVTPKTAAGALAEEAFNLPVSAQSGNIVNALNRMTFGATPALLRQVNQYGFTAYLDQQLNPAGIADTAFAARNVDAMLRQDKVNDWERDQGLQEWRISHAAWSDRQLQNVMALFWENHFWSVPKRQWLIDGQISEINSFRANALGKFSTLLMASVKSPVMMDYLDNSSSTKNGITENYARELLELHTVGVDGGYQNEDIRAVARILTGWGVEEIDHPQIADPERKLVVFKFDPNRHDTTAVAVPFMNFTSAGVTGTGAVKRGEDLVMALAALPQTRKFVCGKLVAQFISEDKPATAMKTCDDAWVRSDGTMSVILRDLLSSADFANVANTRNKAKTPFEYVVGAIRNFSLGEVTQNDKGDPQDWTYYLTNMLEAAGQDFKSFPVPTGFKELTTRWLSTASLIGRMDKMTKFVSSTWAVKTTYPEMVRASGYKTEEGVAAYLLTLATADRFRRDEYTAVIEALRGSDGKFAMTDTADLDRAVHRALGLIVTLPSYQIQ